MLFKIIKIQQGGGEMMTGLRKQRIFVNENLQWASSAYHNQQIGQSDMHH
jgi:hypothetical protein